MDREHNERRPHESLNNMTPSKWKEILLKEKENLFSRVLLFLLHRYRNNISYSCSAGICIHVPWYNDPLRSRALGSAYTR